MFVTCDSVFDGKRTTFRDKSFTYQQKRASRTVHYKFSTTPREGEGEGEHHRRRRHATCSPFFSYHFHNLQIPSSFKFPPTHYLQLQQQHHSIINLSSTVLPTSLYFSIPSASFSFVPPLFPCTTTNGHQLLCVMHLN